MGVGGSQVSTVPDPRDLGKKLKKEATMAEFGQPYAPSLADVPGRGSEQSSSNKNDFWEPRNCIA